MTTLSHSEIPYGNYDQLKERVLSAIIELVKRSRGTCVTFTSKKIAQLASLPVQPVLLTVIRSVLDELCRGNLLTKYKTRGHAVKYMLTKDSLLWKVIKGSEVCAVEDLKKVVAAACST